LPEAEKVILSLDGGFGQAADGVAEEVDAGGEVEEGVHRGIVIGNWVICNWY
jgi:hypothetical protein